MLRLRARRSLPRTPRAWACCAVAWTLLAAACAPAPVPAIPPTAPAEVSGPVRLFSNADPPVELLVFDHRRSRGLVASLGPVLDAVNRERPPGAPPLALTLLSWRYDRGTARVETDATPVRRIEVGTRFDTWLRDFAEPALAPTANGTPRLVLVDPHRGTGLERFAPALALRWGARWVRLPAPLPTAASGGGNVEVLPSGLLLLGSTIGDAMARFWLERGYASRHVRLDTAWLAVGHVDEIVSHVVTGPGPCDFALVRAAPGRALALADADLDPPRWLRRLDARRLGQQRTIETRIAGAVERVRHALAHGTPACPDVPVVEVPVLLRCDGSAAEPVACTSERPNSVNMAVLDRHLLVPDPRYAPFAREVRRVLEARGQQVHLLDADAQHERHGGLHCATAVRRVAIERAPWAAAAGRGAAATLAP